MYLRGTGRSYQLGPGPTAPTVGATDLGVYHPAIPITSPNFWVAGPWRASCLPPPSAVRLLVGDMIPWSGCTFIVGPQNSADPHAGRLGWS